MSAEDLSASNENLRQQIGELSEDVACLDTDNQELLVESKCIKDRNRLLQSSADQFKATMEEMQKKVEDIRGRVEAAQQKIHQLEVQNWALVEANKELRRELHEVLSQVALFRDYKAAQEEDLLEMRKLSDEVKKHLKSLELRRDEAEHRYRLEKSQSSQLQDRVSTLLQLRETKRQDIKDLQAQLESCVQQATVLRLDQENRLQMGSLMHEIVEAKLVDVALNQSKTKKVLQWLWTLGKVLLILVVGCSVLLFLVLTYTYFFNEEFISETLLLFLSEQNIEKIARGLSHYLIWRNNGLLPF
ncbi:hypothetical protein JRQ81_019262 [Phrynocephalus forsythii]|uniref:Uncharacterized protein n=1 Tax=Phrynocephalus forsythii TaxID=171643 RepID=A0A9Q0XLJ6_9SAUR|nr:hypothetical protein JRQ81_019262 [Phrynocephalus forsythii]